MSDGRWHTLTVRFKSDQPVLAANAARKSDPPGIAIGHALREIFDLDSVTLDEVFVVPDDLPRAPKRTEAPPPARS